MKITMAEPKMFQESIATISELVNEGKFQIKKDVTEFIALDPANVCMIIYKMFPSYCIEYDVEEDLELGINLNNFKMILKRAKADDLLSLEFDATKNKIKISMKGQSTRTFFMPILELEDKKNKIPDLEFGAKINITSDILSECIEDADIVSDSISFECEDKKLQIKASGDMSQANIDIEDFGLENSVKIDCSKKSVSKYSIEYLKKMIKGSKINKNVLVSFGSDYPLQLDFVEKDKMSIRLILAPRVEYD